MPLSAAVLLLIVALGMWLADYVHTPDLWLNSFITQLFVLFNAILLSMTLYRAKATAHFSLQPAVLYVLATAIFPFLRTHWQPQLVVSILLFFLYVTRDMSDTHEPNGLVFFVTLLLCLAALFVPDAVWCIVFLWIVVLLQGSFTLRTIVASLLAVILVCMYYGVAMYLGRAEMWDYSLLFDRQWFGIEQPTCIIVSVALMMVAFAALAVCAFLRSTYDLVSTRMLLYHVVLFGLLSAPLILFPAVQPDCWVMLPFALSATASIYLLQKESEARGVTLLTYIICALTLYGIVLSIL